MDPAHLREWRVALGRQVRELRNRAGASSEDAALTLGITPRELERFESGMEDVSITRLWALARSLGMVMEIGFRPVTVVQSPDDVPVGMTECEEQVFWETHEMGAGFFDGVEIDPEAEAVIARIRATRKAGQMRPP